MQGSFYFLVFLVCKNWENPRSFKHECENKNSLICLFKVKTPCWTGPTVHPKVDRTQWFGHIGAEPNFY